MLDETSRANSCDDDSRNDKCEWKSKAGPRPCLDDDEILAESRECFAQLRSISIRKIQSTNDPALDFAGLFQLIRKGRAEYSTPDILRRLLVRPHDELQIARII